MTDLMQEYIDKAQRELAKKVKEGIEFILRNLIDDPIDGEITLEKLRERNIVSFVFLKDWALPDIKEEGKNMSITIHSDFLGVRQGAYIIKPDGERIAIYDDILANTRQEYIDYSGQSI